MIWLGYAAIAVGVFVGVAPRQYRRSRSRHPHTHSRDVAYDVRHAALTAAAIAVAWLPLGAFKSLRCAVLTVVTLLIGRRRIAAHTRAARIEELEVIDADQTVIAYRRGQAADLRLAVARYAATSSVSAMDLAATNRALDLYEKRLGV